MWRYFIFTQVKNAPDKPCCFLALAAQILAFHKFNRFQTDFAGNGKGQGFQNSLNFIFVLTGQNLFGRFFYFTVGQFFCFFQKIDNN